jgi:hypothetical protein
MKRDVVVVVVDVLVLVLPTPKVPRLLGRALLKPTGLNAAVVTTVAKNTKTEASFIFHSFLFLPPQKKVNKTPRKILLDCPPEIPHGSSPLLPLPCHP